VFESDKTAPAVLLPHEAKETLPVMAFPQFIKYVKSDQN